MYNHLEEWKKAKDLIEKNVFYFYNFRKVKLNSHRMLVP
jgi:hypothetical protein